MSRPIYLDNAATTPVEPRVAELVLTLMRDEFGNPHSRTHSYGAEAAKHVQRAREQLATAVGVQPDEVVFTSGATESNNLAILGLAPELKNRGLTHVVTTMVEHKAVLEPLAALESRGFAVTRVAPNREGTVEAEEILGAVGPSTGLISLMHVNNETGATLPLRAVCDGLRERGVFLHTDAAQSFGKLPEPLRDPRIDLISASGHKIHGPKGVGILVVRRREHRRPPIAPLILGGGQERGLRAGTVPAQLVAGFGLATEIALVENASRFPRAKAIRQALVEALLALEAEIVNSAEDAFPYVLLFRLPGLKADTVLLRLRDYIAASSGSACTSARIEPSHVLMAMGIPERHTREYIRLSWGVSQDVDVDFVARAFRTVLN